MSQVEMGSLPKVMLQRMRRLSSDSSNALLRVESDEKATADHRTVIRIECLLKEQDWETVGLIEVHLESLMSYNLGAESSVLLLPLKTHETFLWVVKTTESRVSANLGRTYVFRSLSRRKRMIWLLILADSKERLDKTVEEQKWLRARENLYFPVFVFFFLAELQKKVQGVYQGPVMTTIIVVVILLSFVTAAILWEMEVNDQGGVPEAYAGLIASFISDLELVFVVIFTV
jgi:hypothetical protein